MRYQQLTETCFRDRIHGAGASRAEATLGALFMHFMLETMIAADLLGVDAFDQPAVEAGKVLARKYLMEA